MYTKKLIDDVIKLLLQSSNYQDKMLILSKDEQIKYAKLLLDHVIIRSPMYSDTIFKHLINIDSGDPRAITNLEKIVETYLYIKSKIIVKMDKVIIRPNEEAKTSFMDNLYLIDENTYLDIEAQSELSSSKQLINKNMLYQASVYTNFSVKGEKNAANYHGVIVLCFYEDKYTGNWIKRGI